MFRNSNGHFVSCHTIRIAVGIEGLESKGSDSAPLIKTSQLTAACHLLMKIRVLSSARAKYCCIGEGIKAVSYHHLGFKAKELKESSCIFCELPENRGIEGAGLFNVILDGFPVTKDYSLIIPKRHVETWFDLSEQEQHAANQSRICVKKW